MSIEGAPSAGSGFDFPQVFANTFSKPFVKVQEFFGFLQNGIYSVEAARPAVETLMGKFPKPMDNALKGTSFFHGAMGVFDITGLIYNIRKAIVAVNVVERVKSICAAVINVGNIAMSANAILEGLKSVGVIAKNAIPWTAIVNKIFFPLQLLSLGLNVHEFVETHNDRDEILDKIKAPSGDLAGRVKDLTNTCQYLITNKDRVRKALVISKKAGMDLRAVTIMRAIQSQNQEEQKRALVEGDELIKILRRRINTKYNLEVASLAVKVTAVGCAGLSLFVPANPVTLAVGGVMAVASVALFGLQKLLLNKDPFAQPKDVWYEKLAHQAREFVYNSVHRVEGLVNPRTA